jgi:hypothetical protein
VDSDSTALALAWVVTGLDKVVAARASALKAMLLLWYGLWRVAVHAVWIAACW